MYKRDYYDLLSVDPNATERDIKKAFRNLAARYHPDKNPEDPNTESIFKEIVEAYNILLSPRDRALYDQFGHSLTPPVCKTPQQKDKFNLVSSIFNIASDILDEFLGGGVNGKFRVIRGGSIEYNLDISPMQAFRGTSVPICYNRLDNCFVCKGTGAKAGTRPLICSECKGNGAKRYLLRMETCGKCGGKGKVICECCLECSGKGRVIKERKLTVRIPPETKNKTRLKFRSEGEAGEDGGLYGDLYVVVNVVDGASCGKPAHDKNKISKRFGTA